MPSFARILVALILTGAAPLAPAAEGGKTDAAPKDAPADGGGPSEKDKERENAILEGIPANETYQGLRIPDFDQKGKLSRLFEAKSARRISERDIEMEGLKIEIHNEDGTTFHVEMAKSVFNLDSRILTSTTPAQIRRDDFVIDGEKAEFHLNDKFGRMIGPTKMVITTTESPK